MDSRFCGFYKVPLEIKTEIRKKWDLTSYKIDYIRNIEEITDLAGKILYQLNSMPNLKPSQKSITTEFEHILRSSFLRLESVLERLLKNSKKNSLVETDRILRLVHILFSNGIQKLAIGNVEDLAAKEFDTYDGFIDQLESFMNQEMAVINEFITFL